MGWGGIHVPPLWPYQARRNFPEPRTRKSNSSTARAGVGTLKNKEHLVVRHDRVTRAACGLFGFVRALFKPASLRPRRKLKNKRERYLNPILLVRVGYGKLLE